MDEQTFGKLKEELQRALALAKERRLEEAAGLLEELVDRHPDFLPGFHLLGEIYLMANQPQYAVEPLETAKQLDLEFAPVRLLLGNAYARTLRLELAIAELHEADRLRPDDDEIQHQLGWTHCVLGRLEEGRAYLRRSMALDPGNALAYNDMAASYMFAADPDLEQAHEWMMRALDLDPDDPFIQQTYRALLDMREKRQE